jgi:hypothetical protein
MVKGAGVGRFCIVAMIVALAGTAGCLGKRDAGDGQDAPTDTPQTAPDDLVDEAPANLTWTANETSWDVHYIGNLSAGSSLVLFVPFAEPVTDLGWYFRTWATACGPPGDHGALVMPWTTVVVDDGDTRLSLGTDFRMAAPGDDFIQDGGRDGLLGGTAIGVVAGVLALSPYCLDLQAGGGPGAILTGSEPQLGMGAAVVTSYVLNPDWPTFAPISHQATLPDWTHVVRDPSCASRPDEELKEMLEARVGFSNGYEAHAGPWLNGLFPGPSLSTASFFGTLNNEAGEVTIDIRTLWADECLYVFEGEAPGVLLSGEPLGYVDQLNPTVLP